VKLQRWTVRKRFHWDAPSDRADLASSATILAFVLLLASVLRRLTRRFITTSLGPVAPRIDARWDDLLVERECFGRSRTWRPRWSRSHVQASSRARRSA
jgi:hypothetical protein